MKPNIEILEYERNAHTSGVASNSDHLEKSTLKPGKYMEEK